MERREYIRRLVMNAVCDDYENVDQTIISSVNRDGELLGITVVRAEVVEVLRELFEDGLVRAWRLASRPPHAVQLSYMPPLDVPETNFKTYFDLSPEGMRVHLADDSWADGSMPG